MAVTQYIGSRYVPLFADPAEWSAANAYEALTIVLHNGNSFTSRQPVPPGIDISNESYWAQTGNYNAQIEQYRRDTARAMELANEVGEVIPKGDFSAENTVKSYIDLSVSDEAALRENGDLSLQESIGAVGDELAQDVENLTARDIDLSASMRQYVEATKVGKFEFDTVKYYAQGGCTDGTYIYQVLTTHDGPSDPHTLIVKLNRNYVEVGRIRIDPKQLTPSLKMYHGNSMTYDAQYHAIYTYTLDGQFMIIDTDTFTIARETPALTGLYDTLSCFQVENRYTDGATTYANDRAIAQLTGTNYYILYKRYGDKFVAWGGVEAPPTGIYNFRQDGTIYKNVFYHLLSGNYDKTRSMIRAISMGGTVASDFVITNVKAEFESIFVLDDTFYLINAIGEVYTIPTTRAYNTGLFYYGLMSPYNVNPAVELFEQLPDDSNATRNYFNGVYEWVSYVANSATRWIAVKMPIPNEAILQRKNQGMHFTLFGQDFLGCQYKSNSDIHASYFDFRNGNFGRIVISRMEDNNYYRLANIMLFKAADRTSRTLSISNNELEDLETLAAKIDAWMKESYQAGFTMCDIGNTWFQGFGQIRVRGGGNVAAYGLIDLAKSLS